MSVYDLTGRKALVTGGARGLGAGMAEALARAGAAVVIGDIREELGDMMGKMFTAYWDAVGNPALVVPMGFTSANLPLSLQIAGRPFEEATLLKIGDAYQRVTDWHQQEAPLIKTLVAA